MRVKLFETKCARIKRYDNTNLNTRTCNYEMDFTILNERCTVSKTKRKQRKFTTINTEKRLDKQETKPKKNLRLCPYNINDDVKRALKRFSTSIEHMYFLTRSASRDLANECVTSRITAVTPHIRSPFLIIFNAICVLFLYRTVFNSLFFTQ